MELTVHSVQCPDKDVVGTGSTGGDNAILVYMLYVILSSCEIKCSLTLACTIVSSANPEMWFNDFIRGMCQCAVILHPIIPFIFNFLLTSDQMT